MPGAITALRERLESGPNYRRWVLWVALTGMFATTFPVTILAVSLGDIAKDFDTSETVLAWVISAPMLASALALPILGKMGDLYGQRRVFILGFAGADDRSLADRARVESRRADRVPHARARDRRGDATDVDGARHQRLSRRPSA